MKIVYWLLGKGVGWYLGQGIVEHQEQFYEKDIYYMCFLHHKKICAMDLQSAELGFGIEVHQIPSWA